MSVLAARLRANTEVVLLVVAVTLLAAGGILHLAGLDEAAHSVWALDTIVGIVPATWWVIDAARHRRLGVDALAVLALVGTLVIGEYLAGAVITVMLASGRTLEARAAARAQHGTPGACWPRAPRVVHRYDDGELTSPPIDDGRPRRSAARAARRGGARRRAGRVERRGPRRERPHRRTAAGHSRRRRRGPERRRERRRPVRPRATTNAAESTYAGIVRLVSEAEASSAPFVRLADRYAGVFLVVALALAGAAWAVSGDLVRAVAVLVVATPCPLILAAPVAIVSGLSRAARRGVVVKGGGALERLADGEILLFDKTGTITDGSATSSPTS